ncbi:MAG: hypothetical protein ACT4OP_03645 [Actinomycetota bacterium]
MPEQQFRHTGFAPASTNVCWQALQRPETWLGIGGVRSIDHPTFDQGGGLTGYRFTVDVAGSTYHGTATRLAHEPPKLLEMAIDSDIVGGLVAVLLDGNLEGTKVTVEMQMTSRGFLATMLFPVITGAVATGFDRTADAFIAALAG